MIDSTAKIYGESIVELGAYIGPFCVIGFPSTNIQHPLEMLTDDGDLRSLGSVISKQTSLLSHVVVGEGTHIGINVWCDHHTFIGCSTQIGNESVIMYGARIFDRVRIGSRVWVSGFVCNDTVVEDDAVVLGQLIHRFVNAKDGIPESSPIIRARAFVGMGAMIIGGIEVGEGAYVGAGAVLTKNAQPNTLYIGNPAKAAGHAPKPFGV
jgi:UDP-2-acetamido-3-amino-2,3-dideoxy-glucuronate N-acetyltransferase